MVCRVVLNLKESTIVALFVGGCWRLMESLMLLLSCQVLGFCVSAWFNECCSIREYLHHSVGLYL